MKHFLLTTLSALLMHTAIAQQWVEKQYQYDSLLNMAYGTATTFNGEPSTLLMDIYTPACPSENQFSKWPMLLFVHGGAFLAGSKDDTGIQDLCKQFAKRGYVTASINYRLGFVSDELAWNCNFPNYKCLFATDTTEWIRAMYRGIQDAKGALRYLVNRHEEFNIDTSNIFVAGESAGAFIALGVGLMDVDSERPAETFTMADVPAPSPNAYSCIYNFGQTFPDPMARPDLGSINGEIEPTNIDFTIKGIGNFYGAMSADLLAEHDLTKPKPAIYSFHQPCDIIVPIDHQKIYWGLSWCMANGYNCYGIANTPMVYGSRAIANLNADNNYGYTMQNEFTAVNFPYSFLFGQASCTDQVNNPCHAFDNRPLRENNMAEFFAGFITSDQICDSIMVDTWNAAADFPIQVFPNPVTNKINIEFNSGINSEKLTVEIYSSVGGLVFYKKIKKQELIDFNEASPGLYFIIVKENDKILLRDRVVKN